MIALYIILGILLLLFLITLLNVWALISYNEELKLFVKIAFVKLQLVPPKPKKEKKKPEKKPKKKKKTENKEPEKQKRKSFDFKDYVKEKGVSGILNIIRRVADLAVGAMKDLFSKITVTKLSLRLRIAGSDAADTAVKYGRVCSVLYPALKIIAEIVTVKDYNIDVEPDFSDEPKNSAQAEVIARIRIISILSVVFKRGFQALRLILKAKPKHRRIKN
ncbi:MAG: DUF2953 domain-containing protein [Ruminococcus sp.]|nr:DUF2953 domain-containing protein [Ruminococcus sp.]